MQSTTGKLPADYVPHMEATYRQSTHRQSTTGKVYTGKILQAKYRSGLSHQAKYMACKVQWAIYVLVGKVPAGNVWVGKILQANNRRAFSQRAKYMACKVQAGNKLAGCAT